MTDREKRQDDARRTEIAMMRVLIERYPQQALDQLRQMQQRVKTVNQGSVSIVIQSA